MSGGQRHLGRLGAEVVRYDVRFYHSALTSQAVADAYVESPRREAVFGDYSFTEGQLRLEAGLRYDHFRTGASRPDFPRISSAPGFDPSRPSAGFVADRGHGRLSPRVRATVEATPRMTLFGGFAVRAQLPDFGLVLQGINTDLSTTGSTYTFGSDLDLETSTVGELGARFQLDRGDQPRGDLVEARGPEAGAGANRLPGRPSEASRPSTSWYTSAMVYCPPGGRGDRPPAAGPTG